MNLWRWVAGLIVVITVAFVPNVADSFWRPKEVFFLLGTWIALGLPGISHRQQDNRWVGWWLIWVGLQFGWNFLRHHVFIGSDFKVTFAWWTLLPTLDVLLGLMLFDRLVRSTDSESRWRSLATALIISAVLLAGLGLLQYYNLDPLRYANPSLHPGRMPSFFGNTMVAMPLVGVLAPLALMFRGVWMKLAYGVCAVACLLSHSALAIVTLAVGTLLFLWWSRRRTLCGVLGVLCLLIGLRVAFTTPFFTVGERPYLIQETFKVWRATPEGAIFGKGLGGFAKHFAYQPRLSLPGTEITKAHAAHNEYVQALLEFGLLGSFFAIMAIGTTFLRALRSEKSMLLAGFLASGCAYLIFMGFAFPLRIGGTALPGLVLWAGLAALANGRRNHVPA